MEVQHLDAVVEIEKAAFSPPWTKTLFFQETCQPDSDCYVLLVGQRSRVAAYAAAWTVAGECTLNKIACSSDFRRHGYATKLLAYLARAVSAKGAKVIFIETRVSNDSAIAFYAGQGFKKTGVRKGYYVNPREDAVLMILDLETYFKRIT